MPESSPPSGAAEMAIPAGRACRALSSFSISGRCRRYAQTITTFQRDRGEHSFGRPMQGNRPVFLFPPFSAGEPKTRKMVHLRRRSRRWGEAPPARDPCRATARRSSSLPFPQVNRKRRKGFTCAGGKRREGWREWDGTADWMGWHSREAPCGIEK